MHARISYAVKILLSVAIVFVLSGLIMRYVTFGNQPELNRGKLSSELADTHNLFNETITAIRQFPDFLMKNTQETPAHAVDEEIIPDANIPVAAPLIRVSESKVTSALPSASTAATTAHQVLGTASARIAD